MISSILNELEQLGDPERAEHSQRYFKTGEGEYGEGDRFLGIRVPVTRKLASKYKKISIEEAEELLHSPLHEARLLALFILIYIFKRSDDKDQKRIYTLYRNNTDYVNNWGV